MSLLDRWRPFSQMIYVLTEILLCIGPLFLINFTGLRNESEDDSADDRHYYEFRNGRFVFLKTIKRRASDETSQSKTVSRH